VGEETTTTEDRVEGAFALVTWSQELEGVDRGKRAPEPPVGIPRTRKNLSTSGVVTVSCHEDELTRPKVEDESGYVPDTYVRFTLLTCH